MAKELSNTIAHVITANFGGSKNNGEDLSPYWYTPSDWGVEAMQTRVGQAEVVQAFKEIARIAIREIGALQTERSDASPFQPHLANLYDIVIGFGEEGGKWVISRLWQISRELKSWTTEHEIIAQAWDSQYSSFEDTRKIFRVLVSGVARAIHDGKRNVLKNVLRKRDVKFLLRFAAGEDFVIALYEPEKAQLSYKYAVYDANGNHSGGGWQATWQYLIEMVFKGNTIYYSSYFQTESGGSVSFKGEGELVIEDNHSLKPQDLTDEDREAARKGILNYLIESQAELSGDSPSEDDPEAEVRAELTQLFTSWRLPDEGEFWVRAYLDDPEDEDDYIQLGLMYHKTNPAPDGVEFDHQVIPYTDAWETMTKIGTNLTSIKSVTVGFVPTGQKFYASKIEERVWRPGQSGLTVPWNSYEFPIE